MSAWVYVALAAVYLVLAALARRKRGGLAMELAAIVVQTTVLVLGIWDEWREGKYIRCVLIAATVLLIVVQTVIELRKYLRARKAPADQTETDPKR